MESGGEALPWKNKELYKEMMRERSIEGYRVISNNTAITFFDRGILDTLCYARLINSEITESMDHDAKHYRYNEKVFILPPWREIYETDNERKQDWEESVRTFEMMKDTYQKYSYELIEVPKISIEKRAGFVETHIK
jgi:predicted ATPase